MVALASIGHKFQRGPFVFDDLHYKNRAYTRYGAYGQSKASNILFAKELAARRGFRAVRHYSRVSGLIFMFRRPGYSAPRGWQPGVPVSLPGIRV